MKLSNLLSYGLGVMLISSTIALSEEAKTSTPLFNGKDLTGWKIPTKGEWVWSVKDQIIHGVANEKARAKELWTTENYKNFELQLDWRFPDKPVKKMMKIISPTGDDLLDSKGEKVREERIFAGDSGILIRGDKMSQINISCKSAGSGELYGYRKKVAGVSPKLKAACVPLVCADHLAGEWNHFKITVKSDRVTVVLNGKLVINNVRLPRLPKVGPIALQHHGEGIEFKNISIKTLE